MRIQEVLVVLLIGGFVVTAILTDRKPTRAPVPPPPWVEGVDVPFIPPERIHVDPETGMEFVWVDAGCYEMGCGAWTSNCHEDEFPVHTVCLEGFWMGRFPVTQSQWLQVFEENPSLFRRGGDYPVESLSWHEAREFAHKLNARGGDGFFRLPTEAEWEYACRSGGQPEMYAGSDDPEAVAWHRRNSGGSTQPVGLRRPNGLGLFDMSGNVFEWTQDEYARDAYQRHEVHNPILETSLGKTYESYLSLMERYANVSLRRVIRGGSWQNLPDAARCSHRIGPEASTRKSNIGFRLVVELPWTPPGSEALEPKKIPVD